MRGIEMGGEGDSTDERRENSLNHRGWILDEGVWQLDGRWNGSMMDEFDDGRRRRIERE
jgi:hypothetical protein